MITNVRILELTSEEKERLRSLILGYGKLKEASVKSGMHTHTLRNISRNGYAEPKTVEKLRKSLLAEEVPAN